MKKYDFYTCEAFFSSIMGYSNINPVNETNIKSQEWRSIVPFVLGHLVASGKKSIAEGLKICHECNNVNTTFQQFELDVLWGDDVITITNNDLGWRKMHALDYDEYVIEYVATKVK